MAMSEDELEIAILEQYIKQFELAGENNPNKCARELDIRDVIREIVRDKDQDLEMSAKLWHNRLAPRKPGRSLGVLRPCSDSTIMMAAHKYHARAFTDPINNQPAPAWDRIRELKARQQKPGELIQLNPNFYGFGLNLKEVWRRLAKCLGKNT